MKPTTAGARAEPLRECSEPGAAAAELESASRVYMRGSARSGEGSGVPGGAAQKPTYNSSPPQGADGPT